MVSNICLLSQRQVLSFSQSTLFRQAQMVPEKLSQHLAPRKRARDDLGAPESIISNIPSSARMLFNSMENRLLRVKALDDCIFLWLYYCHLCVLPSGLELLPPSVLTMGHPSQGICTWRSPVTQSLRCSERSFWRRIHYEDKALGADRHLNE